MADRTININRQQQQKIRNAVADYRWKSGTNVQLAEFGVPIIEPSNSPTPSVTPSFTMTPTVTVTPSTTISVTPTRTPSNTITPTVTQTPSSSTTPSNTIAASSSATPSFTQTPTKTPSNTATPSITQTPSNTLTPSNTNTPTATPSNTVTTTPSLSPSATPSITTSPTATIPVNTFIVTANGSSAYIINGQSNPTLSTSEGQTYTFSINASGHPFWIKTVNSTGTANAYNDGVTNNGTDNGTITFVVPYDAPSTLYYNCQFHASMAGAINVTDVPAPTATPTQTPTNTATPSNTITPTKTPSNSATPSQTQTPSNTVTPSYTTSASPTPSITPTPSLSPVTSSVVVNGLALSLDAGLVSSYPGSGSTWTDTITSKAFTLFGSPTYSSSNGGYLSFVPASSQYAASTTSLTGSLTTWTVEAWHYYTGTNSGGSPCIVTETFPGSTARINYSLGSNSAANLQSGFFDGGWRVTPAHTLTTNAWYQIVGTYDGTTNKLYVNNSLVQSGSYTGTPATSQGGIRLMRRWDLTDYWGGRLSVVKIYNRALSSTEVGQNYTALRSRFGL